MEICDVLLLMNNFDDDWGEFEDFLRIFKLYNEESRNLPALIYLIKGASNDSKKNLAFKNIEQNVMIWYNESNNGVQSLKDTVYFLPDYFDDETYKNHNQSILDYIQEYH